jgi:hypothetical protein
MTLNPAAQKIQKVFYESLDLTEPRSTIAAVLREIANQITAGNPPFGIVNEHFSIELEVTDRIQKQVLAIADELHPPTKP